MQKVRVTLSEEASMTLIAAMERMGHSSPTHTANLIITKFSKLLSPSEETNARAKQRTS